MEYIVCCIARNEERYLNEWIMHYLGLGFDHIIIADNNDDVNQLPNFLKTKPYKDRIIIVPKNGASNFQCPTYAEVYKTHSFKWCAFFDCDEFLELTQHDNIRDYLAMFPDDCYTVSINWLCYGTNGHKTFIDLPVRERFPYPRVPVDNADDINGHVKTIVRKVNMDRIEFPTPHYMKVPRKHAYRSDGTVLSIRNAFNPSYSKPIQYDYAYIQHFNIKSEEEFLARGKNPRQNTKNPKKNAQIRLGMLANMGDKTTPEIENALKLTTPQALNGNRILIRSKNMQTILGCLKQGKEIVLVGSDKRGDRLNMILNVATYNRVKSISWRFNDKDVRPQDYDVIVN